MNQTKDRLDHEIADLSNELQRLADEVRLKVHLAGMEARDAWERLEPRLLDFERRAERGAEMTLQELRSAGHELRERLHHLRERL